MDSFTRSVSTRRDGVLTAWHGKLSSAAALVLVLASILSAGSAQQVNPASSLPEEPTPINTINLRPSDRDFSKPAGRMLGNPFKMYRPTRIAKADFNNSTRLQDLMKDGKIYLSLSDAITLALENNYDIGIGRYYLDIADTDILRSKAGLTLRGVGATVLQNTLGGTSQTLSSSGAPGAVNGATAGSSGLVLTEDGAGPAPESRDPLVGGTIELERLQSPETSPFQPRSFTNTNSYDFTYTQGFTSGAQLSVTWNNSRITTNGFSSYSPELNSNFRATVTQHLLQGAGVWVNKRLEYEGLLDRRITDSTFRQQILTTVNQVEDIYWVVVSAYEDVQAKERALEQSTQLDEDTRQQFEVGSLALLDVTNADASVAADKQALTNSRSNLNYQQLILKQAIARNLDDLTLLAAPIIPMDRVSLDTIPEEAQALNQLTQTAFENRPELEQAVLSIKKDEITLHGTKNALLPTLDAFAFYGGQGIGGAPNTACQFGSISCAAPSSSGYPAVLNGLVNGSSPDRGVGFNFQLNLRNRGAQADHARSLIEYRQAEMHTEQLYTQIRMQVAAQRDSLTNDRAQVQAANASVDFARQSLSAEQDKLKLGASTIANVLLQERNLAIAENSLITADLTYAKDRALFYQVLGVTLQKYNINLADSAKGQVMEAPLIPGVQHTNTAAQP